ncbi:hypothetical protein E2P74_07580 [Limosilactobacillus fermentum]|uniref:phage holin, LLH family n=1 Tax=Limosilactobacillus fermentum TaxID=1613 RepID=UPI001075C1C3|nr:phage holin, LLH family [Limosilactobacillus fermentum]TFZ16300.1 hypothetical protein E2P74_07845 [Limosilactobacillus fermentum]TFZ16757.1 hypothetical protein E2P74_07580 [Limosilactobacillus fermentum]
MKTVNDIAEWLLQSGALVVLVLFLWGYAKPLLTAKAKTAKTEQSRQLWTLAEQVAEAAVNAMASRNLPGTDKYAKAVDMVQTTLSKHGHHIAPEEAEAVVQSVYEKSGLASQPVKSVEPQGSVAAIDPKEAK